MKLTKSQFKRWMTARTRQYVGKITDLDPNYVRISFYHNFNKRYSKSLHNAHALCCKYDSHILYRMDYLDNWDVDWKALDNMIIHEVCHLNHDAVRGDAHTNVFFTEYKKWSGDDFIERYHSRDYDFEMNGLQYVCGVKNLPIMVE
jgi:hypothetical protein